MTTRRKAVRGTGRAGRPRGAAAELEALLAPLDLALPAVPPPPGLWDKVSAALDAEVERAARAGTLRIGEGPWEPYSPGVTRRWLWDRRTFLLRIAPGAVVPPHAHDEAEHCVVIEGTLAIGSVRIGPGDYHVGPAGTAHVEIAAPGGALILVHNAA